MADTTAQVAFQESAPADERQAAQAELQKAYMPLASALLPNDAVKSVMDYIQDGYAEADMAKAAQVIPFPGREKRDHGMQSVYLDNLQVYAHGDYYDRQSPLSFDALRQMVDQTPVLSAVIMTRIRQVQRFCAPQEDDGPGFVIRHVDRDHQLTKDEEQSIQLLQRFITNCGWEFQPRKRRILRRDNFSQFMAKSIRDSLTLDSSPIELEMKRDKVKGIDGFYAVDGATLRLCTEDGYRGDDEIYAVQVVQGRVLTAYTREDLIYEPRNPRTDVRLAGYGLSETELLVRVVTGFLNAMTLNIKGFTDNAIPRGMLHLSGNYSQEDLIAFRRYWNGMVKGVNNSWSLPVMVSADQESKASFENFGQEFNEMYFSKWMTFLTSIICSVYGMAPDEINFESFSAGTSSLSGDDTSEKLAASKDKGLRPLMAHYESIISDYIISDFSEKFVFRWAGLDEEDQDKRHELKKLVLTVNEIRAQEGYDAMKGPLGDAPVNPSLMGAWMQAQQPPEQQQDFGPDPEQQEQEQAQPQPPDHGQGESGGGDFGKAFLDVYEM